MLGTEGWMSLSPRVQARPLYGSMPNLLAPESLLNLTGPRPSCLPASPPQLGPSSHRVTRTCSPVASLAS